MYKLTGHQLHVAAPLADRGPAGADGLHGDPVERPGLQPVPQVGLAGGVVLPVEVVVAALVVHRLRGDQVGSCVCWWYKCKYIYIYIWWKCWKAKIIRKRTILPTLENPDLVAILSLKTTKMIRTEFY